MNKNKSRREEQSRLESTLMLLTCATVLYAILLAFIQLMYNSSETIEGAAMFLCVLQWAGAIFAMGSAAWSAYRDKRYQLRYSGAAAFLFITAFVAYRVGSPWGFYIDYLALLAAFGFSQGYGVMAVKNLWTKKRARGIYFVLMSCTFLALAALVAWRLAK